MNIHVRKKITICLEGFLVCLINLSMNCRSLGLRTRIFEWHQDLFGRAKLLEDLVVWMPNFFFILFFFFIFILITNDWRVLEKSSWWGWWTSSIEAGDWLRSGPNERSCFLAFILYTYSYDSPRLLTRAVTPEPGMDCSEASSWRLVWSADEYDVCRYILSTLRWWTLAESGCRSIRNWSHRLDPSHERAPSLGCPMLSWWPPPVCWSLGRSLHKLYIYRYSSNLICLIFNF